MVSGRRSNMYFTWFLTWCRSCWQIRAAAPWHTALPGLGGLITSSTLYWIKVSLTLFIRYGDAENPPAIIMSLMSLICTVWAVISSRMRSTKKLPLYLRIKAPAHHTHPGHTRKHLPDATDSVACQAPAKLRLACRWGTILQSKISCDQNLLLFPPTSPRDFSWCQGFARGNFANTRSCCRWRRQNCGRRACLRTTHQSSETLP